MLGFTKQFKLRPRRALPLSRWGLSFIALCFAWVITPFTIFDRKFSPVDFEVQDSDSFLGLEKVKHRYDFVLSGDPKPECPGMECPLSPSFDPGRLKYERVINHVVGKTITADGWRGTMYLRWDILVPEFVGTSADEIAFDFYGVVGKEWRFFVNGIEQARGVGGPTQDAIKFKSPGPAGSPLTIGFEIDVGRSLSPGVSILAQPFISRPSVSKYLRQAYVGLDKEHLIPISIPPTVLALLAAISCFLTPFYREILAFAFWVSFINWRFLLMNNLVPFPSVLDVDFITFASMLKAAILACHWAFLGLFFRIKSKSKWIPVGVYAAALPFLWLAGKTGFGIDAIVLMYRTYEWQLAFSYLAGAIMGFNAWSATRKVVWARYRAIVAFVVALASVVVAYAYVLMGSVVVGFIQPDGTIPMQVIYSFVTYGPRGFILLVGFVIALEWAMIVRDRQRVLQRFGRVVDPRLVQDIIRGPEKESKLIPHAVILFIDIRSFTTICEVFSPDRVVRVLNEYLDVVTTAIQNHGGVVDKFVGDAVMAIWGVPQSGENDSLAAVAAAIEIRQRITALNAAREADGEFGIDIGIGIHAGPTIFGAMGNGVRVDHTVIGPTINIASRLESMTKALQCDIVISHSVLEPIEDRVLIEDLGFMEIRGMMSQVGVAKLIGVQLSEDEFVIGHETLEMHVNIRRPGRVVGTPNITSQRDYRGPEQGPKSDITAA